MSADKATPRPWTVIGDGTGWYVVTGASGEEIAVMEASDGLDEPTPYPELENAELIVHCVNHFDEVVAALEKIAAFNDTAASEHLEKRGSYSLFDEPGSVEIARKALAALKTDSGNETKGRTETPDSGK